MNDLRNIESDLPTLRDENITNILLYGNNIHDDKTNKIILMHLIQYIRDSQRFDEPLLIHPKLLLTSYTFVSVSLFNTHKL